MNKTIVYSIVAALVVALALIIGMRYFLLKKELEEKPSAAGRFRQLTNEELAPYLPPAGAEFKPLTEKELAPYLPPKGAVFKPLTAEELAPYLPPQ